MAQPKTNGTHLPKPLPKELRKDVAEDKRRGAVDVYSHPALPLHEARRVAVAAIVDPRSVLKYLHGHPQRPLMVQRIEDGLRRCGLENLIGYATRAKSTSLANDRTKPSS